MKDEGIDILGAANRAPASKPFQARLIALDATGARPRRFRAWRRPLMDRKRRKLLAAGAAAMHLARALALDPDVLFFDEPSAGLDPITSRNLDQLILELRDDLGATFVVVTHELRSIFAIADNSIFLDPHPHTVRAQGNPHELLKNSTDRDVREFLTGGQPTITRKPERSNTTT